MAKTSYDEGRYYLRPDISAVVGFYIQRLIVRLILNNIIFFKKVTHKVLFSFII